jgi:hypothetical protein
MDVNDITDPLERVGYALRLGTRTRREDIVALHKEVERLRALIDKDVTFRDLETKIRDGHVELHAVGQEGGDPSTKFLAAIMLNAILGPDNQEPPNYQGTDVFIEHDGPVRSDQVELSVKPAGEARPMRLYMEVVKQGGRSSREIRAAAENRAAELADQVRELNDLVDRILGASDEEFYRGREVRSLVTGEIGLVTGVAPRSGRVAVEFELDGHRTKSGYYDRSDLEVTGADFDDA